MKAAVLQALRRSRPRTGDENVTGRCDTWAPIEEDTKEIQSVSIQRPEPRTID